jgi:hypothetical protein
LGMGCAKHHRKPQHHGQHAQKRHSLPQIAALLADCCKFCHIPR